MILTTKGRYAVIAMMDLTSAVKSDAVVRVIDIAMRQKLPVSYLEQIFSKLRNGNIVVSVKGPGGGYKLARDAEKISILDIMNAVNEEIKMTRCVECKTTECIPNGKTKCMSHGLWKGLSDQINNYFRSITLEDLFNGAGAAN